MKLKITFLLVIQILAVTISAKTNKSKSSGCGCGGGSNGGGGLGSDEDDGSRSRIPNFEQLFKQAATFYFEKDQQPNDPIGQALIYCIKTNYSYGNRDYSDFVVTVNNRCPHYDGQSEVINFFKQTISCVNNIKAPKQSVKTAFIASLQCVVSSADGNKQQQALAQKKKIHLKSQISE
ncbi:hypothetical protein ABPG74_013625 [Tetrahymena malaccensis]